eukprot:scaffold240510_cov19-Tisochrysis_lutea.AAC.1
MQEHFKHCRVGGGVRAVGQFVFETFGGCVRAGGTQKGIDSWICTASSSPSSQEDSGNGN